MINSLATAVDPFGFIRIPYVPQQMVSRPTAPSMSAETIIAGLTAAISAT